MYTGWKIKLLNVFIKSHAKLKFFFITLYSLFKIDRTV